MKKIEIRNPKTESVIAFIFCFLLGGLLIYWATYAELKLQVSGAKLDKATSQILLYIIAVGPILGGVNYFLKYLSIIKYGEFAIVLDTDKITYPDYSMFSGFKKASIEKNKILFSDVVNMGKGEFYICLRNFESKAIANISSDICTKKLKPNDLADQINTWLKLNYNT